MCYLYLPIFKIDGYLLLHNLFVYVSCMNVCMLVWMYGGSVFTKENVFSSYNATERSYHSVETAGSFRPYTPKRLLVLKSRQNLTFDVYQKVFLIHREAEF